MDPKVQKNLTDAIEELEEKLKPLQGLDALSDNLTKVGGDLSATAKALEQSGKPFPEALAAFKRASDLLSEVSTLIKNADPKVVAESLSQVDSSLKSLSTELRHAIEGQGKSTDKTLDDVSVKIRSIADDVSSGNQRLEQFSGDTSEKADAISQEIKALSESVTAEIRRSKTFSFLSGVVSLVVGAAIIGLLITNG